MPTYYVLSPNIEVTAEVDAPDSRHARTAFLDYLARNGRILYSQRQEVRKQLITKRMQPGEIQTSVQLEYGVAEPPTQEVQAPRPIPTGGPTTIGPGYEEDEEGFYFTETPEYGRGYPPEEKSEEQPLQPKAPSGSSPIMDLSRKSGGM